MEHMMIEGSCPKAEQYLDASIREVAYTGRFMLFMAVIIFFISCVCFGYFVRTYSVDAHAKYVRELGRESADRIIDERDAVSQANVTPAESAPVPDSPSNVVSRPDPPLDEPVLSPPCEPNATPAAHDPILDAI